MYYVVIYWYLCILYLSNVWWYLIVLAKNNIVDLVVIVLFISWVPVDTIIKLLEDGPQKES